MFDPVRVGIRIMPMVAADRLAEVIGDHLADGGDPEPEIAVFGDPLFRVKAASAVQQPPPHRDRASVPGYTQQHPRQECRIRERLADAEQIIARAAPPTDRLGRRRAVKVHPRQPIDGIRRGEIRCIPGQAGEAVRQVGIVAIEEGHPCGVGVGQT